MCLSFGKRSAMASASPEVLLEQPLGVQQKVLTLYNLGTPERLKESTDLFEEWVKKQAYFVKRDFPKEYLEKSLVAAKGSLEKAKQRLDKLCTVKTVLPKFFTNTNVKKELQDVTLTIVSVPFPKLTEDYCRVLLIRFEKKSISPHHFMDFYQYCTILCEYVKMHDYVAGFVVLNDIRNINIFDAFSKLNTVEFQQYFTILTKVYGASIKKIYLLTESKAIEVVLKLARQLLTAKMNSRIHVITDVNDLQNHIPSDVLPKDYGGTATCTQTLAREWVEALSTVEHVEYMKVMNMACTDESKRQIGKFNDLYMGMPGSFRNLSVD